MIQQIIISTLSALGLSALGQSTTLRETSSSSPWYFDFGTSNLMTKSAYFLTNVKSQDLYR